MTTLASAVLATSIVFVDVSDDLSPSLLEATLRSCNLALGPGRCRQDAGRDDKPRDCYIAKLRTPADAENVITIELAEASEPFALVATRSLRFHNSDRPDHRWATTGVVVAALVVSAETVPTVQREQAPAEPPPSRPPPKPARAPQPVRVRSPQPVPQPAQYAFRLDLAALAGSGFDPGPWRVGGQIRSSLALTRLPVLAWVGFAAARRDGTFSANWYSGQGGLGLRLATGVPLLDVEGRLGGVGSLVAVAATKGSERQELSAWRWGAVGAVDVVVLASEHLHTVVGWEGTATWPVLEVEVDDQPAGREPTASWGALIGLRWVL